MPPFVSMIPGNATHEINSITTKIYNLEDIVRSFLTIKETSNKAFIIKNIQAKNKVQQFEAVIFKSFYKPFFSTNVEIIGAVYLKEKGYHQKTAKNQRCYQVIDNKLKQIPENTYKKARTWAQYYLEKQNAPVYQTLEQALAFSRKI